MDQSLSKGVKPAQYAWFIRYPCLPTVVGSDEMGAPVDGQNQWQWVFQTPQWAYHVIHPARAAQVVQAVMADAQPQVCVSDAYSAQMNHPAQH